MNITGYVKSLKGVTTKDEVLIALDNVIQDLGTKTLPVVDTATAAMKTYRFKSTEIIGYDEKYRNELKVGRNASIFADLQQRLHQVAKNLMVLRESITKTMPETVTSSAIDYRSAVLMQLVDNSAFLMRFIRRFVEVAIVYETETAGIYEDYRKNNVSAGEAQWLNHRFGSFLTTLESLSLDTNDFKKKFEDIPNVTVDVNSSDDFALFGRLKMDPFKLGFIPVILNPFFHVGKWIAEFQAWRYKEAQEDLIRIQKRILMLEEAVAGKANPKIEKELEILRDKSSALTYKINKAEEDL